MQNKGNGDYHTYTTSEDGVLIPLLSMKMVYEESCEGER